MRVSGHCLVYPLLEVPKGAGLLQQRKAGGSSSETVDCLVDGTGAEHDAVHEREHDLEQHVCGCDRHENEHGDILAARA